MTHALKAFASDLLSTIAFVVLFALTGNALLATLVGMGVGAAQIGIEKWRGNKIETMQWLSLVLVIVFGGVSLLTQDNRFIMVKPTLIDFVVGAVMLKRGWLDRYLPDRVHALVPASVIMASGYAWAGLEFALGIANLAVALLYGFKAWAYFASIVPTAAQVAAFGLQYLVFRMIAIRKLHRSGSGALSPAK